MREYERVEWKHLSEFEETPTSRIVFQENYWDGTKRLDIRLFLKSGDAWYRTKCGFWIRADQGTEFVKACEAAIQLLGKEGQGNLTKIYQGQMTGKQDKEKRK